MLSVFDVYVKVQCLYKYKYIYMSTHINRGQLCENEGASK